MMQIFHLDVSKINLSVVHIVMAIHACFKHMFQVFHLFQTYIANVSSECCKSRSGVAHVAMAIHACFKCFISFRCMLQVLHLDVSNADLERAHVAITLFDRLFLRLISRLWLFCCERKTLFHG
jgi:hypothetical protein